MGVGAGGVKLYLELWQRNILANIRSVVDMGSQELHIGLADFESMIEASGISGYEPKKFANLTHFPEFPRCTTKPFYQLLGATDYSCIDISGAHDAIPVDLNEPLADENLYGKFDMVTDHGTNEHVFNVAETYRTMHRLCKVGGIIVVIQALYGGNGYYNFDLAFFEGMAAANNYDILFSSYSVAATRENGELGQYHIPNSRDLLNVLDLSKVSYVEICYVFRKTAEDDFKYAYQGVRQAWEQGNLGYRLSFLSDPPTRTYVPILRRSDVNDLLTSVALSRLVRHTLSRGNGKIKKTLTGCLRRLVRR